MKGAIHIYTGDGKGKTTAALGLCIRALGHGMSSFIIQFMKGRVSGEVNFIKSLCNPLITIEQYGCEDFFYPGNDKIFNTHKNHALAGFNKALEIIKANKYGILVLDEILNAIYYKLLDESAVIELLLSKPEEMEIILTGRFASERLIEIADLVSEVREIKHYYKNGREAKKGIEL